MKILRGFEKSVDALVESIGLIGGIGIAIITVLNTMEPLLRYIFGAPTTWSLSLSTYIFLWIIFLGSAYSFKTRGHVRVEMFLEYAGKRNPKLKRVTALIGYLLTIIYLSALTWFGVSTMIEAFQGEWTTQNSFPIPDFILYLGISVGSLVMILIIISIVIKILKGETYYLTGESE